MSYGTVRLNAMVACCLLCVTLLPHALHGRTQHSMQCSSAHGSRQVVENPTFHSSALGRDMHYRIILPAGYTQTARRFPVLYLLHGLEGSEKDWVTRTHLAEYSERIPVIIVMPDAGDSWYVDSAASLEDKYDAYISKDLIAEIDSKYRTINDRHGRAVAGLSMGGYAAMKLALKSPQMFAFAGSLSGALNAPDDLDDHEEFRAQLLNVFGPRGSQTRVENDVFLLASKAQRDRVPYLFLSCGNRDEFLQANREFVSLLQSKQLAYEYHEMPGRHDWSYWDSHIREFLQLLSANGFAAAPVRSTVGLHR